MGLQNWKESKQVQQARCTPTAGGDRLGLKGCWQSVNAAIVLLRLLVRGVLLVYL
jgi:hypothetical protein